jgi:hypothetical protein
MSRNLSTDETSRADMSTSGEGTGPAHLRSSETFSDDIVFMGRSFTTDSAWTRCTTDSVDYEVTGEQQRMVAEKMKKALSDEPPKSTIKLGGAGAGGDGNPNEGSNNRDSSSLEAPLLGSV